MTGVSPSSAKYSSRGPQVILTPASPKGMPYTRVRLAAVQPVRRPHGERGDCERERRRRVLLAVARLSVRRVDERASEARCAKRRELDSASPSWCFRDCCITPRSRAKSASGRRRRLALHPTRDLPCPSRDQRPIPDPLSAPVLRDRRVKSCALMLNISLLK